MEHKFFPGRRIREQVAELLRGQIQRGELPPGARLPAARELAQQLNIAEANVHHAMAQLAKEGLIARRQRTGSVVLAPEKLLTGVAIFIPWYFLQRGEEFTRLLTMHICEALAQNHISSQVIYDTPDGSGRRNLAQLIASRQIQGVISRSINVANLAYFQSLGVFFTGLTSQKQPHSLSLISPALFQRIALAVAAAGVASLGVIYPSSEQSPGYRAKLTELRRALDEKHIALKSEWIFNLERSSWRTPVIDSAAFAWQGCEYFQNLRERPAALLLLSDDLVYGVTAFFYHYHIAIPGDCQLFIHHTRENPVRFPFPCTLIQQSIQEIAQQLVHQILAQSNGTREAAPELTIWTTPIL